MMLVSQHGPSSTPPPDHHYHRPPMDPASTTTLDATQQQQQQRVRRKRKADSQDANNERLSKRLSLLNLEQNGSKLYVPVENPKATSPSPLSQTQLPPPPSATSGTAAAASYEDSMQLDDSKYKVYIYNIDDELSSESEAEDGSGRLVFLPDIEKHMRINRLPIPPPILPNSDGELAGMQMVLYNVPSAISVAPEQDSVRKAIIESRARIRARQQNGGKDLEQDPLTSTGTAKKAPSSPPLPTAMQTPPLGGFRPIPLDTIPEIPSGAAASFPPASEPWEAAAGEDSDAMEID